MTSGAPAPAVIEVLGLSFGGFPAVTPLNPRFLPGHDRLKLTLEIRPPGRPGSLPVSARRRLLSRLQRVFPALARHRCCGDHAIDDSLLLGGVAPGCGLPPTDAMVDIAHLLEHLVIDFQHHIAAMRRCSGITCGHAGRLSRFDLFVESPDRGTSRLSVALAVAIMNDLLAGHPLDPVYERVVGLARRFRAVPRGVIDDATVRRWCGDAPRAARALEFLIEMEFVGEVETSINYSGARLFATRS